MSLTGESVSSVLSLLPLVSLSITSLCSLWFTGHTCWVCCVALPCCLFDLACFFLPSFSSLIKTCACLGNSAGRALCLKRGVSWVLILPNCKAAQFPFKTAPPSPPLPSPPPLPSSPLLSPPQYHHSTLHTQGPDWRLHHASW